MGKGIAIASGTAADFSRTDSDDMILMGLPGCRQLLQITAQKGTEAPPVSRTSCVRSST